MRIVTYNVHSCIGLDGRLSSGRIARVLADLSPDIVALQELDVGRLRTGGADQSAEIAKALEMELHFHPCLELTGEQYGNAVLSRLPMQLKKAARFPVLDQRHEPRGAMWVTIDLGSSKLDLITTHFGLTAAERARQTEILLGEEWLRHPDCGPHVVVCGDFNAGPKSSTYRQFAETLQDAQRATGQGRKGRTWFGPLPLRCIDHVFVSNSLTVEHAEVVRTATACVASDHLPLMIDVAYCKPAFQPQKYMARGTPASSS